MEEKNQPVISSDLDRPWISKRAVGTPASVEALFVLIEKGLTNSSVFRTGLRYLRATEEDVDRWFKLWLVGKVHPELEERKKELNSPWLEVIALKSID